MRRFAVALLVVLALGYAGAAGALALMQRSFIYRPDPAKPDLLRTGPAGMEELALRTSDGETLVAWHAAPRDGRPLLLHFHGNSGNAGLRWRRYRELAARGFGVLAVSYRGYGGSTGSPSEAGLHADAKAGYAEAVRRYGPARVVAFGESLGTGVAARLAAEQPVAALILEAPFRSIAVAAKRLYGVFPVDLLLADRFDTEALIAGIRVPVLIAHGRQDEVTPFEDSEVLFARATGPRRLLDITAGTHDGLYRHGFVAEIEAFLADAMAGRLTAGERRVIATPPGALYQ
jgi:hypothetical protein